VGRFFPYWYKVEVVIPTRGFQGAGAILKYLYLLERVREREKSLWLSRNKAAFM
jgi:hypothetical protein